jgi:hypothetical protein
MFHSRQTQLVLSPNWTDSASRAWLFFRSEICHRSF